MDGSDSENLSLLSDPGPSGSTTLQLSTGSIPGLPVFLGLSGNRRLYMEISCEGEELSLRLHQGAAYTTSVWRLTSWSRRDDVNSKTSGSTSEEGRAASGIPFITT